MPRIEDSHIGPRAQTGVIVGLGGYGVGGEEIAMNGRISVECEGSSSWLLDRSRAMEAIGARRWSEALATLGEALVEAPDRELSDLYALRAYVHLQLDQFHSVIDDASACLKDDPVNDEALWWRAIALSQLKRWDEAIADQSRAVQLASQSAAAQFQWLQKLVESGIEDWKSQWIGRSPSGADFAKRARWLLAIGETQRAARDLVEAERLSPELPRVFAGLCQLASLQQLWPQALSHANRWLELEPSSQQALATKARVLIESGDIPAATSVIAEFEERFATLLVNQFEIVRLWQEAGNRLRALHWCDRLQIEFGDRYPAMTLHGRLLMELRSWRSAAAQWREIVRLRPSSLAERILLGRCLVKLRRFDEATRCFEEAVEIGPTVADVHAGLAQARWAARDPIAAKLAVERALRLDTTHLAGRVISAHLEMSTGRIEHGLNLLADAWERASQDSRADSDWLGECAYAEGVGWLERGETEKALLRFDAALQKRPEHPGTWVWRAKARARLGRIEECRQDLEHASRINPSCAVQYQRLGHELAREFLSLERIRMSDDESSQDREFQRLVALEMSGHDGDAWKQMERKGSDKRAEQAANRSWDWQLLKLRLALKHAPDRAAQLFASLRRNDLQLSQVLALIQTVEAASWETESLAWLEDQAVRYPHNGRLARQLGMAYHLKSRVRRAANWLSKAVSLGQIDALTIALCGVNLLYRGESEEACRYLSLALEQNPNEASWLAWRGEARLKLERFEEALSDFELALTIDSVQVTAYCGRAMVMARRGDWEPALQWLTKALHRFPSPASQAQLLQCRGRVYFNMRRYRRAIVDWDCAVGLQRDEAELADLLFQRAVARFHQGEMEQVRTDLDRALLANPKHKGARVVMDWLENRTERFPSQLTAPRRKIQPTRPMTGEPALKHVPPTQDGPAFPLNQWIVRKADGREFGPLSQERLIEWIDETRIAGDDWLLRADWNRWRRVAVVVQTWGSSEPVPNEPGAPAIDLQNFLVDSSRNDQSTQSPIPVDDSGIRTPQEDTLSKLDE